MAPLNFDANGIATLPGFNDADFWAAVRQQSGVPSTGTGVNWGALGPTLMALSAGLLSGDNWRQGASRGLALASEAIRQRQRDQTQHLQNALNAYFRNANLNLRQREIQSGEQYRNAQIERLQNPEAKIGGTVEDIRAKLARGETLTPGQSKVYEDALKADPIMRLLGGLTPSPSTSALPFEPNAAERRIGQVYNLPNGKQGLWQRDASGNTGWELLN